MEINALEEIATVAAAAAAAAEGKTHAHRAL